MPAWRTAQPRNTSESLSFPATSPTILDYQEVSRWMSGVVDARAACAGLTVTAGIDRVMQRTRRANAV